MQGSQTLCVMFGLYMNIQNPWSHQQHTKPVACVKSIPKFSLYSLQKTQSSDVEN